MNPFPLVYFDKVLGIYICLRGGDVAYFFKVKIDIYLFLNIFLFIVI